MSKNLLVKNIPFEGVRAVISASQSGIPFTYYSQGGGDRYYVNFISSTASAVLESATFQSFLSFTMSGAVNYSFDIVPMLTGESIVIDTIVYAQNSTSSKGYLSKHFGSFRHSGSALTVIGGSIDKTTKTDFTTVNATFSTSGTQSIRLTVSGETSETLDWDVHISYKKGYHSISGTSNTLKPIYPNE